MWPASPEGREPAPVALTAVAPLGMSLPRQYALMGALLIAPTVLIFVVVIAYPLVYAIYLSFFSIYTPTSEALEIFGGASAVPHRPPTITSMTIMIMLIMGMITCMITITATRMKPASNDHFLAAALATTRLLRLADGPDEVHRNQIGRLEIRRYQNTNPARTGGEGHQLSSEEAEAWSRGGLWPNPETLHQ